MLALNTSFLLWSSDPGRLRLATSYVFRRDIAISQLLNGSLRIAIMLIVLAAEIDVSMSVRLFKELTFTKAEPNGLFSVKIRSNYCWGQNWLRWINVRKNV